MTAISRELTLTLTKGDVIAILRAYDEKFNELVSFEEWDSSSSSTKTYTAVYTPTSAPNNTTHNIKLLITLASTHALDTLSSLHDLISKNTSIPLPSLLKRDDSTKLVSSPYALYAYPAGIPLSSLYASSSSSSSPQSSPQSTSESNEANSRLRTSAELSLGAHLKSLHTHVQNYWFGPPGEEGEWGECYSWQEAFTLLLETVFCAVEEGQCRGNEGECEVNAGEGEGRGERGADEDEIPIEKIRLLLSRAIGSYLFDDVEVPSLVLNTSPFLPSSPSPFPSSSGNWSSRVYIHPTGPLSGQVSCILLSPSPVSSSSVWGDPLLEGVFHPSPSFSPIPTERNENENENEKKEEGWPSKAFLEGYEGSPFILPRHHTKRMWYDLFLCLQELCGVLGDLDGGEGGGGGGKNEDGKKTKERARVARAKIRDLVKRLEDAPCY